MKTFKQHIEELAVRDPNGKLIKLKKIPYRGSDMKIHTAYPGKSASSGGGSGGGAAGSGDE
jgi:hypothetical protein